MSEFQIEKRIKDNNIITDPINLVDKSTDIFPFTRAEKIKLESLTVGESNIPIIMGGKINIPTSIEITGISFSGTDLSNSCFNGMIHNNNFSYSNLTDAKFPGTDVSGCNFNGAKFLRTSFGGTKLSGFTSFKGCNLSIANINGTQMTDVDLNNTNCTGQNFGGTNFLRCNLLNTNFSNCIITTPSFTGYQLLKCNFNGSSLGGVHFNNVDLNESTFAGSKINETDFTGATMPESCNTKEKLIAVAESVDKYSIWIDGTLINPLAP